MKTLILILVVATTGLAVASVQFYRQASSERSRADAEVVLRQKQDTRIHELERSRAHLEEQLLEAQRPQAITSAVSTVAAPAATPPVAVVSRLERRDAAAKEPAGAMFFQRPGRGPMDSEAGRRFMQTQMRGSIRRLYQDVGRDLNLSQEQANKLIELMADQQTRQFDTRRQPPADRAAARQTWQQLQEQNNKEVAALLGESRMAEWKAYQQTLPQRSQVDAMGQQLENAGVPLSSDQRTQLVAALVEEAQLNPRPTFAAGLPQEEFAKQYNEWQDAYDKSVSERAKQVLSSDQYQRYSDYTEWMAEMRKNLPTRAFRSSNGAAPASGPNVLLQLAAPDGAVAVGSAVAVAPPPPPRQ
jgi:hypothetical protein